MLNGVDAGEVAALERDLDRRIARCSEDAAAAKRRIAAETRRRKRKAEELQKHERLTFNLHADLVNGESAVDAPPRPPDPDLSVLQHCRHWTSSGQRLIHLTSNY